MDFVKTGKRAKNVSALTHPLYNIDTSYIFLNFETFLSTLTEQHFCHNIFTTTSDTSNRIYYCLPCPWKHAQNQNDFFD
jgi:hypothetical protein